MSRLAKFRDGPVRKNRAPIIIKKTVIVVVSFIVAIFFLLPTVLTFTNSFMSKAEIAADYGQIFATTESGGKVYIGKKVDLKLIPEMVTGEQYVTVLFKSPDYLFKFWNSVFYAVPIALFQILLAMGASYAFARIEGKWKDVLFFIYIIICLMPYQVTLVPNYLVSDWLHILNTRWAIWLPGISSPFAVYLLTKHMKRIPKALYEAARVDGANDIQQIWYITLPHIKPTFIILLLYALGSIMKGQFELFYQLIGNNGVLFNATDIFDTYVYRITMTQPLSIGLGTAAGLYQSLFGFLIIVLVNYVVKKRNPEYALF
jgi:multiple sugar transport system permease protein